MGDIRNERPTLRGVDPYKCSHPKFLALWRFRGRNETIYRCMVCGSIQTVAPSPRPESTRKQDNDGHRC